MREEVVSPRKVKALFPVRFSLQKGEGLGLVQFPFQKPWILLEGGLLDPVDSRVDPGQVLDRQGDSLGAAGEEGSLPLKGEGGKGQLLG